LRGRRLFKGDPAQHANRVPLCDLGQAALLARHFGYMGTPNERLTIPVIGVISFTAASAIPRRWQRYL
jgi:hypothetical protein